MKEDEYLRMAQAESRSWWFRGRRRILDKVIAGMRLPAAANIVDVGCGTGGNLPMLSAYGKVAGVEFSPVAASIAREQTGLPVMQAAADDTGIAGASADMIMMSDVLEHLHDDAAALGEVYRVLNNGGRFLFTVPAFMFLWSGHDVALHHFRRYRRRPLRELLEGAGFVVEWISYYNTFLFPAVAAVRLLRHLPGISDKQKADTGASGGIGAATLETLFAAERHLVGRIPLPFGVSIIGVARKPKKQ